MNSNNIADSDCLYLKIHKSNMPADGKVAPSVFIQQGDDGLSTDWCILSDPHKLRNRVLGSSANPKDSGVISVLVGPVRAIQGVVVSYDPEPGNPAHTLIVRVPAKPKSEKQRVRLGLYKAYKRTEIAIPPKQ